MSARKRSRQPKGGEGEEEKSKRLVNAPEYDPCNYYSESVGLMFDPKWVLLRRVFFLNSDRSKYVSVGFYPALDYQPLVEFGGSLNTPILITPDIVESMANTYRECATPCVAMNIMPSEWACSA
jgi:hypothetical protein